MTAMGAGRGGGKGGARVPVKEETQHPPVSSLKKKRGQRKRRRTGEESIEQIRSCWRSFRLLLIIRIGFIGYVNQSASKGGAFAIRNAQRRL
jgi:hypothetical protein